MPRQVASKAIGTKTCHCPHMDKLVAETLMAQMDIRRRQAARTPLIQPTTQPASWKTPPSASSPGSGHRVSSPPALPLAVGPLGALGSNHIFDDRTSISEDFKFKGLKGVYAWKSRAETCMVSRVAAVSRILYWAKREDGAISPELLHQTVGHGLTTCDREGNGKNHTESLNSAEAEIMFRQADPCAEMASHRVTDRQRR